MQWGKSHDIEEKTKKSLSVERKIEQNIENLPQRGIKREKEKQKGEREREKEDGERESKRFVCARKGSNARIIQNRNFYWILHISCSIIVIQMPGLRTRKTIIKETHKKPQSNNVDMASERIKTSELS